MKKSILTAVAIYILRCEMSGAATAILEYDFTRGYLNDGTIGWAFSPRVDLFVTALGCETMTLAGSGPLPRAPDGVGVGMPVGLWNADGAMLVSGFVHQDPAAGGWMAGNFRFESIPPTLLAADQVYRIGCSVPGGTLIFSASGAHAETVTDPLINLSGQAFIWREGFTFPSQGGPDRIALGPNFEFTVVPEPQSVTLFALGGIMLSVYRHKKREKRAQRSHSSGWREPAGLCIPASAARHR